MKQKNTECEMFLYKTLLLTSGYQPIKRIDCKRAICMSILEKVDVIESYDRYIGSPSIRIQIPSVIRLKHVIKTKPMRIRYSRANIYTRDDKICQYCNVKFQVKDLTLDHVIPKSCGGRTSWSNIVTCCQSCNTMKADRTPQQAGMLLVKKPKYPSLKNYFESSSGEKIPEQWEKYLY